ncbi:hypothetical protein L1987_56612 [Smallanthus sonchifolius]|uniref:Uncharacterized protein n=1 Tax=Smallanthus sonchifolius TaxID=185202 RepID=A0ACB9ECU2_9ASTR|nr:hypothetical protein L1987_56612 [Smallanthus sonchifolius]
MKPNISTLLFTCTFLVGLLFLEPAASQNCNCGCDMCCSQYGYCGTESAYCGKGCQGSPCSRPPPSNNAYIPGIVTASFFKRIVDKSARRCSGRGFYTRDAFLKAIKVYPRFGRTGSIADSKREIVAFFAHVTHETGHFCYKEEINGHSRNYCDKSQTRYPCNPKKGYYGRGPLQLTWNYNYGKAGKSLRFDGLNNPDIVARDPVVSFKTALWFWMNNVHPGFTSGKGFGATIRAINGGECNGNSPTVVNSRVSYYTAYCKQFGVPAGKKLRC